MVIYYYWSFLYLKDKRRNKEMKPILELKDLSFEIEERKILENVSFSIDKGEFVTLTGPSGSGKSTLLKLIGHLISPTSGNIYYKDKDITEYNPTDYRKNVSYFFQNATLFDKTVYDNLAFPAKIREEDFDKKRALEGLHTVQLSETYLNKPIHELSGGERQRVALVRNLMYSPNILLMDEVTSSLDQKNKEIILSFINHLNQEEKMTILWITHDTKEINESNRLIQLKDGKMEDIKHD